MDSKKEFKHSCSDIEKYHFFDNKVFVVWEWIDDVEESSSETSDDLSARSSPELISDYSQPTVEHSPTAHTDDTSDLVPASNDSVPAITHSVLFNFKCIGADKERNYQEVLYTAVKKHGDGINISFKLRPEPNNKYDSKAIALCVKLTAAGRGLDMLSVKLLMRSIQLSGTKKYLK